MTILAGTALRHAETIGGALDVRAERMRRNIDAAGGLLLAEAAAFALAAHMPLQQAQALVAQACREASASGRSLIEVLRASSTAPVDWDRLRDPANSLAPRMRSSAACSNRKSMKLLSYMHNGRASYGAYVNGGVVDLRARLDGSPDHPGRGSPRRRPRRAPRAGRGARPGLQPRRSALAAPGSRPGPHRMHRLNYKTHIEKRAAPCRIPGAVRAPTPNLTSDTAQPWSGPRRRSNTITKANWRSSSANRDAISRPSGLLLTSRATVVTMTAPSATSRRTLTSSRRERTSGARARSALGLSLPDEIPDPGALTLETRLNGRVMRARHFRPACSISLT